MQLDLTTQLASIDSNSLIQLFEHSVELFPEKIAVFHNNQFITYSDLSDQASAIAAQLIKLKIPKNSIVNILIERNINLIAGILGVLKAGCAYTVIDPDYPINRIKFILNDTDTKLLLTDEFYKKEEKYKYLRTSTTFQSAYISELLTHSKPIENHIRESTEDTLACVIYTSGSTGNPKGSLLSHKAILRLLNGSNMIQITSSDCIAQIANGSFDAAIYEIWAALGKGGSLVIIDKDITLSTSILVSYFKKYHITSSFLTTGLFNQLAKIDPSIFKVLKNVLFGGEAANPEIVRKIINNNEFRPERLFHMYGPTECGVFATYYEVKTLADNATSVPIGSPVNNTQVYVLDENLNRVEPGEFGELYISGDGVARGYLNLPDLTSERFMICPFDVDSKMYKTGDLVKVLPDGMLDFVGRKDNQVKIRGHRIELEEIENALESHPEIWKGIVLAPYTQQGHRQLITYFVPKIVKNKIAPSRIKTHCKEILPDYMIPGIIIQLESLPLTPHGKVDRQKLLELPINESTEEVSIESVVLNEIEKTLLEIWKNILGVNNVQLNDNFFDLGGDSIMIMQMIAQSAEHELVLSHSLVLQHPTIKALASLAKGKKYTQQEDLIDQTPFDLSAIQAWYFDQSFKNPNYFHHIFNSPLRECINIQCLKKSIEYLIEYHDVFQLRFFKDNEKYQQYYSHEKLSNHVDEINIKAIERYKSQLCNSIDIHNGPLVKVAIFTDEGIPKSLMIVIHHLIIDGISWRILISDLSRIYKGLVGEGSYSLPSNGSSFKTWVTKTREYAFNNTLLQEYKHWLNTINKQFSLPIDHQKGLNIESSNKILRKSLNHEITQGVLKIIPYTLHVEINGILLTALFQTISKWSDQSEIILELEGHGREDIASGNFARTVGWFTGLFPFALKSQSQSLKACLFEIQTQLKKVPVKGVGYGILKFLNENGPLAESLASRKNIPIRFNYLGQFDQNSAEDPLFEFVEEPFSSPSDPENERTHLLIIESWVTQGQLQFAWHYSDNYHRAETIEKLAVTFNETLGCLIKETQTDSIDISLTQYSLQELNEILPDINEVQSVYSLLPIQEGLLFHSIHDPKSHAYFVQTYWNCKKYDTQIMLAAWDALLVNHELFRASYLWEGLNYPIQVIYKEAKITLIEIDWSDLSTEEQETKLPEYLAQDRNFGMDLKKSPLMRLSVIRLSNSEQLIVWSFHHILVDGWSICRIIEELDHYYSTLYSGKALISKQAPSFGDYVGWYKRCNHSNNKLFWDQYLDGFTSANQISLPGPVGFNNAAHQTSYCQFDHHVSKELSDLLHQYAKDNRLTLNIVMQGMWAYLLSIYCNTLDVVFGLTISTRPSEIKNVNSIVGPLINTLPFRVIIDKTSSVSDYLQAVQNNLADIVDHSFYSHIEIQRGSQVVPGSTLFNSSFGFESQQVKELEKNLSSFYNIKINEVTHYPLSLYIIPGERMQFKVSYDENQYSQNNMNRLIDHYVNLLSDIVHKKGHVLLNQLSCLSSLEFKQITNDWNQTDIQLPENISFIDIFEKQAQENPESIVVIYKNTSLSYLLLNERANQLANHLKKLGIKNNDLVGICLDRSPEILIAILGILKAGAAYIPLDPAYPADRLNYIMEDSGSVVFITSNKYGQRVNASNAKKVKIDSEWDLIAENHKNNPKREIKPKDLAYVIYTSGSTGKPKGVMVHQLGFFNYLYSATEIYEVAKGCNAPVHSSVAFDATITSLFLPLFTGGTVTLVSQENEIDELYALLRSKEFYHLIKITPAHLDALGDLFEANQMSINNIKVFVIGGDALHEKTLERWRIIAPGVRFFNEYGPTETVVGCSVYEASVCDPKRTSVPIGHPIGNTQLYILDEYQQPVPQGVVGELYIGGIGVANGYLNRHDLTNEKFITNKFSDDLNAKLFKTGDLARFQEDGNLEFLGRKDNQVKIRGFRIELQEIESILLQYALVKEAIVNVYKDISQNSHIVAYLVTQNGQELDIENIRNYLSASLPQYMLPTYYIVMDKLPLTVNGKIDRKVLPEPKESQLNKVSTEPRNAQEQKIADIWARVLEKSNMGIHDNFFDQGGDSLNAIRLISQIRKEFGLEISVRSIFDAPTIIELSELLTKHFDMQFIVNNKSYDSKTSFIIPLQKKGNKKSLFLIHPIGGTVFCYMGLKRYIDDRPIYGIEDPGINASPPNFNSLEELADYYIQGIKQIQPEGPYLIGGASLGGLIAIEIANQLNANGESIEFIGLFDSWAIYPNATDQKDWFEKHMQEQHEEMNNQLTEAGLNPKDPWFNLQWNRKELSLKYKLPIINNKITLFKAEILLDVLILNSYNSPTNRWDPFCRNLKVINVPGDHYSMFNEQNIEKLGHCVKNCLT